MGDDGVATDGASGGGASGQSASGGFASLSLTFGPQQPGFASTSVTGQASGGPVCAAPLSFSASGTGVSGGVDAGGSPDLQPLA